jgi:hypothetical protein
MTITYYSNFKNKRTNATPLFANDNNYILEVRMNKTDTSITVNSKKKKQQPSKGKGMKLSNFIQQRNQ